jgi:hypothetical protein
MLRHNLAVVATALILSAPLAAQSNAFSVATGANAPDTTVSPTPATTTNAPVNATVARPVRAQMDTAMVMVPREPSSRNTAMMIVGGAGLLAGAVVGGKGGTIIMIGGAGVGLLGLWNYLK